MSDFIALLERRILVLLIGGVLTCAICTPVRAAEALVAVATNFLEVMQQLAPAFEDSFAHELKIASGSTGALYAQITRGAPFDVFLAADQKRPQQLQAMGHVVDGQRFTYAVGQLTLWSVDDHLLVGSPRTVLTKASFRRLAVANPKLAPYGLAAEQTLRALGLRDALRAKLAFGQNIGQT